MRLLVCEFVTGGGLAGCELPDGLRREGDMMLRALVKDLTDLPQLSVSAARDWRLPPLDGAVEHRWIAAGDDPWTVWRRCIAEADAVLPVAPETGGALERLTALVLQQERVLLGSRPDAVRRAASKLLTCRSLTEFGIAAVPTWPLRSALEDAALNEHGGLVAKPDDGAGSEDTFLLGGAAALGSWVAGRNDVDRFVVQPYLAGPAVSLSLLCADGRAAVLSCNGQDMRLDGERFRYHGGIVGGREDLRSLCEPIAAGIAAAFPGLWGLVGADLVETSQGLVVLEVNPRVTTSYAGLRHALGRNPAKLLVGLATAGWEAVQPSPVAQEVEVSVDAGTG